MPFTEIMFLDILRGYVASLAKTSDSYSVVEYPGATITKNFLAKSGRECHRRNSYAARDRGVDCGVSGNPACCPSMARNSIFWMWRDRRW